MPHLRKLTLFYTQVTSQGLAGLHEKIPECRIGWNGGVIEP
jgi:hypothetical protein